MYCNLLAAQKQLTKSSNITKYVDMVTVSERLEGYCPGFDLGVIDRVSVVVGIQNTYGASHCDFL